VTEMGLTADGRILAVVRVGFDPGEETTVPAFDWSEDESLISVDPVTLRFFPPFLGTALWALVDVGNGSVLASTAPQILEINHQTEENYLESRVIQRGIAYFDEQNYVGGPYAQVYRYGGRLFVQHCTPEQLSQMEVLAEVSVRGGTMQATVNQ